MSGRPESIFIYFAKPIGMEGPYKIGCSRTPQARLLGLMAWCPFPLEMIATAPGTYVEERRLFCRFREFRQHGEWFRAAPELIAFVQKVKDVGRLPFSVLASPSDARRPLLGLPVILKRHRIPLEDFAAAARVRRVNIGRWLKEYPGAGAGSAAAALDELGYSYPIQALFDGPEIPVRRRVPNRLRLRAA